MALRPIYDTPDAAQKLLQAVLTAHATIVLAQTKVNPDELHAALKAGGHPAGD